MFKKIKHMADRESLYSFLSNSVDKKLEENIKTWVLEKLIDKNSTITQDTKIAFFEAEKILFLDYINTNNVDKIINLFNTITSLDNPKLNKMEWKILADSINEQKEFFRKNTTHNKNVAVLLQKGLSELSSEDNTKNLVYQTVQDALEIVNQYKDDIGCTGETNDNHTS